MLSIVFVCVCMHLCIGVHACVCAYVCIHVCMCVYQDVSMEVWCWSSSSTLFQSLLVCCPVPDLWPSRNSPGSTSCLAIGTGLTDTCYHVRLYMRSENLNSSAYICAAVRCLHYPSILSLHLHHLKTSLHAVMPDPLSHGVCSELWTLTTQTNFTFTSSAVHRGLTFYFGSTGFLTEWRGNVNDRFLEPQPSYPPVPSASLCWLMAL